MSKVDELIIAIETLPEEEYVQFRKWFTEKDWLKWDAHLEADSAAGKLDFLVKEALHQKIPVNSVRSKCTGQQTGFGNLS